MEGLDGWDRLHLTPSKPHIVCPNGSLWCRRSLGGGDTQHSFISLPRKKCFFCSQQFLLPANLGTRLIEAILNVASTTVTGKMGAVFRSVLGTMYTLFIWLTRVSRFVPHVPCYVPRYMSCYVHIARQYMSTFVHHLVVVLG